MPSPQPIPVYFLLLVPLGLLRSDLGRCGRGAGGYGLRGRWWGRGLRFRSLGLWCIAGVVSRVWVGGKEGKRTPWMNALFMFTSSLSAPYGSIFGCGVLNCGLGFLVVDMKLCYEATSSRRRNSSRDFLLFLDWFSQHQRILDGSFIHFYNHDQS